MNACTDSRCLNCIPRWPMGTRICGELFGAEIFKAGTIPPGQYACTLPRGHDGPHYTCQRKN